MVITLITGVHLSEENKPVILVNSIWLLEHAALSRSQGKIVFVFFTKSAGRPIFNNPWIEELNKLSLFLHDLKTSEH